MNLKQLGVKYVIYLCLLDILKHLILYLKLDEEIINKNFDEKWLYETYFETYSHRQIKYAYWAVYDDYMYHYRAHLST